MSTKGGYQIINLDPKSFSSGVGIKIKGAYDAVNNSNGKRTIISGAKTSTLVFPDFPASFMKSSTAFTTGAVTVGNNTVTTSITNDDTVTITIS